MALFLAIKLPEEKAVELSLQLSDLKKTYPDFRWVAPSDYHITVQFIGEISDVDRLKNKIEKAIFEIPSFYLFAQEADLFFRQTLVMYVGVHRNRMLRNLMDVVREELHLKEKKGKEFMPHLTFARYRIPSKQQYLLIKKKVQRLKVELGFLVTQITLFDSVIENNKSQYKIVAEFPLVSE